jgi:riboflavin kinase/FMN adenylyltransferase
MYLCSMIVSHNYYDRMTSGQPWVATVGFFDGVHRGHRFLIDELRRLARERALPAAVLTFDRHPRTVLHADFQPELLYTLDERLAQLASTGIDCCAVIDFTPELAALTARQFITDVLDGQWNVRTLLVGYDHRFGCNRTDSFSQYVAFGNDCGMETVYAPPLAHEGHPVSSSCIRRMLHEGRVEDAAQWLAQPYRLSGRIVEGKKIGRTIGFPTANITPDDPHKVRPGMGVYAVRVYLDGQCYGGMLSIGNRPTLGESEVAVEVHILRFAGNVYGKDVDIEFVRFLRENIKFASIEALRTQLVEDCRTVEALLDS